MTRPGPIPANAIIICTADDLETGAVNLFALLGPRCIPVLSELARLTDAECEPEEEEVSA